MNQYRYLPLTETDKKEMLDTIGVPDVEALFSPIPKSVRFEGDLKIPAAADENSLVRELSRLASKNVTTTTHTSFLGAGVYTHAIPAVVDSMISRSEFYTAYTPYQPEISQGELQAIFEFQTMVARITGMDIANSSMYDGGTSLGEAAALAAGVKKRSQIVMSELVHPEYQAVVKSYCEGRGVDVVIAPSQDGITDVEALKPLLTDDTAAVIVQYPNFLGQVEPIKVFADLAHDNNSLFITSSNPLALGLLTPPGAVGADIVVGDTQVFGISEAFGGPHCGYFAVTKKLMRKVPGRLVGQTADENGKRGFVLTLQAREQHIRRDKATSNICSNQALNALASSIAMASLGKNGLVETATLNFQKAQYARQQFAEKGFNVTYGARQFNEFVVGFSKPVSDLQDLLIEEGFIGGYDLGRDYAGKDNQMLIAVTEVIPKTEIDRFIKVLEVAK